MESKRVIIFGATGATGTSLAQRLSAEHPDWHILAVTRSTSSKSRLSEFNLSNVEIIQGDPFDSESVLKITTNCDIIYCCIGFHNYETKYWSKYWPIVINNLLLATTKQSNTKLVFCDNLYAYGEGPIKPNGKRVSASFESKPAVRAFLHEVFQKHMKEYPGTLSVVGAADFFGPGVTDLAFLGDSMTGRIVSGSSPIVVGASDKIHDFCFIPDLSKAMEIVSLSEIGYDRFWICPHSVHDKTMQEIANDIARLAGKQSKSCYVLGPKLIAFLGYFIGFMGEVKEMLHIWTKDYQVDDTEFQEVFNVSPTPYEDALKAYVEFYQTKSNEN